MISFATEFPVRHDHGSGAFLKIVRNWILGSPHTVFVPEDFHGSDGARDWSKVKGNERVGTLQITSANEDTAAVRYIRSDDGLEWQTMVVFSRHQNSSWVGVRIACEARSPIRRLPPAKKPVIVRTLLDNLGGASDGPLKVSRTAHILGNDDIELAARLITDQALSHLPVVYVSCGFHGEYIVDINAMAEDLAGMAHVVIEPNRSFSYRLKLEVNSNNVYGGTIGVHWPNGGGRRSFYFGPQLQDQIKIKKAIIEEVREVLSNRHPLNRCTWGSVQEAVSQKTYSELRAAGSKEVNEYIEQFDKDFNAKNERLLSSEKEIERLRAEIRKYEIRSPFGVGVTLKTGKEQDLYEGEINNVLLDAVKDYCSRVQDDSRRKHILLSIVNNNDCGGIAEKNREKLKDILREFREMTAKLRKSLEDIGFSISDNGKHFKLVFQGDDRYTFSLPKSGSDHRGGLNAASDISKRLF